MSKTVVALLCALTLCGCAHKPPAAPVAPVAPVAPEPARSTVRKESPEFWRKDGQAILAEAQKPANTGVRAKNLILFVGDGMSVVTVTAARIFQGQAAGATGEEAQLSFERFPATALAKTYNTDLQTPEAAGAMSAIMTGVKTRGASLAMDETPLRGQCGEAFGHETKTLLETAKDAGLSAGLVSTARITHAAPAATYAHVTDRDWETDARMPRAALAEGCRDIARQLVEFHHHGPIDVVMGGGRLAFMAASQHDPGEVRRVGARVDGQDLLAKWRSRYPDGQYVWTANQLRGVDWTSTSGPLLGLFAPDHMAFEADRAQEGPDQPSLTTMVQSAIAGLQRNPRGFVLVVVAGGIDRAHHAGNARRALIDTVELAKAVEAAAAATKEDDTLIVVTADHGHTLTMGGYPQRGNPILGTVVGAGVAQLDALGAPYTTLAYANGPGAAQMRPNSPSLDETIAQDPDHLQAAAVPMQAETHGGEDVAVYARGPGSQWVHGMIDQHGLYWIMQAALDGLHPTPPPAKPPGRSLMRYLPKLWHPSKVGGS